MLRFDPAPDAADLPAHFPNPFDRGAVHPLARRAAHDVQALLQSPAAGDWRLDGPNGGKMFGVLIVRAPDGAIGYLRAFSGMLGGHWIHHGWSPPTFAMDRLRAFWPAGEAELNAMTAAREALTLGSAAALAELDVARAARSNELLSQIQALYHLPNAEGETRTLHELFAPAIAPGGAGDCAGPKLLAHAYGLGVQPLAMAEFWWGAPPRSGDRRAGVFYAACRGKCGPVLTHMLGGLSVAPATLHGASGVPAHEPRTVHEDAWLAVVEKPCGLLSVPGRSPQLRDAVLTRLQLRYPTATGPLLVHRLDLDTSGLMLVARQHETFVALQRQFADREVEKGYTALLDGDVRGDAGVVSLSLRVDVTDRPRQIHDAVHGKAAITEWRVLAREAGRTRVALTPRTGRTHQLRVHAAHPDGLDAPIVGDRLYGRETPAVGERLMLHAGRLAFRHPARGDRLTVESPTPF